jgi:hypothetical protein
MSSEMEIPTFLAPLEDFWDSNEQPPLEIELGTVEEVCEIFCAERKSGALDNGLLKYHVFLLPPSTLCKAGDTNFLSQEDLTHVFFSEYHPLRQQNPKFHSHMVSSWILTIRKPTLQRNKLVVDATDVAFLLFHLPHDNHNALVEFICVANGIDGSPTFTPERRSFTGLDLENFLCTVLRSLLLKCSPEGASCSITGPLLTGASACLPNNFVQEPQVQDGYTPACFLKEFWGTVCPQLNVQVCSSESLPAMEEGDLTQAMEISFRSDEEDEEEFLHHNLGDSSIDSCEYDPVDEDEEMQRNNPEDFNMDNSGSETSDSPVNNELPAEALRKRIESIFLPPDSNLDLDQDLQDPAELSVSELEKVKAVYDEYNRFSVARPLVGGRSADETESSTFDQALQLKLDTDSCLVHASTPGDTASTFNGVHMIINHPYGVKRNSHANRILVSTRKTLSSGRSVPKYVDMAKFRNFEIAKLYVSEHHLDFTMNLHIIEEETPSKGKSMVSEATLFAWKASLNFARLHYQSSPIYLEWLHDPEKKPHATEMAFKLASICAFDVQKTRSQTDFDKHLPPVKFRYLSGCLFLKIVWEKLVVLSSKQYAPRSGLGSSKLQLSSIQEAALALVLKSHTVAQSAGFRHEFPSYTPADRPSISSKPELHHWMNQEHQKAARIARSKIFSNHACPSAFATLDVGFNFLSDDPKVLFLVDAFKAQTILKRTTKVKVHESESYYRGPEHPQQPEEQSDPSDQLDDEAGSSPTAPRDLVGRKVQKVSNLSIAVSHSPSFILLFTNRPVPLY